MFWRLIEDALQDLRHFVEAAAEIQYPNMLSYIIGISFPIELPNNINTENEFKQYYKDLLQRVSFFCSSYSFNSDVFTKVKPGFPVEYERNASGGITIGIFFYINPKYSQEIQEAKSVGVSGWSSIKTINTLRFLYETVKVEIDNFYEQLIQYLEQEK